MTGADPARPATPALVVACLCAGWCSTTITPSRLLATATATATATAAAAITPRPASRHP